MGILDYFIIAFYIVLVVSLVKRDYVYVALLLVVCWFLDREGDGFALALSIVLLWFLVLVLVHLVKWLVSKQKRTRRTAGVAKPQQAASVQECPKQPARKRESTKPRICKMPACEQPVRAGAYMTPAELLKWWPGRTSAATLCRECYDRQYPPLRIT